MKLLLTSGGLLNDSIIDSLKKLAVKPLGELRLGYIPTAANIEEGDKGWLIEDLEICKKLNFRSIDIIDISAISQDMFKKRLEETDIILVGGGNTYHLMCWIKKSGLEEMLPELLKSRIYVGVSAGSVVAGPSLVLADSEKEEAANAGDEIYDEGLSLVDFIVEPHLNSPYFPEQTFDYVEKESERIKHSVYALDDNSAVQVTDGEVTVVSEGNWKKFN
ncbi:Type 1 glutamine amidotransferase-like domain-containing protein [Patescibacteria group bacterium]